MYQFTEDCMVGITQIDEEHRRLFEMINETQKLLQEKHFLFCEGEFHWINDIKSEVTL